MLEKIKGMIADQLLIDANDISESSRFVEDLKADSLDVVQMLIALENEYGFTFEEEEMSKIRTVGDAVKLITEKTKNN